MLLAAPSPIAPVTTTPPLAPGKPDEPFYGSRWERSYEATPEVADRLQAYVDTLVPRETMYPNPQRIQTVHVRSSYDDRGPKEKFRIRTYLDSPGPPNILEFKDKVVEDGHKITKKVRIPLAADAATRLMWGESGASVIGLEGRSGPDVAIAERAIKAVDELHVHPVVNESYVRTSFEDAKAGVRITFDRNIHYTGIGELVRGGSFDRPGVVMDIKVTGETPEWVKTLLTAEIAAKHIVELKDGKGATAVTELRKRVDLLDAHTGGTIIPHAA